MQEKISVACYESTLVVFDSEPRLDWTSFFSRARPVEIEIGCGKGAFLLAYGKQHPERSLLGIENQPRWAYGIAARLEREPQPNVRVLCADAAFVIARLVVDASVAAYHVYFPDPWWKRRHHKRRLVERDFGADLYRTLAPGGVLHLATDVADRFATMQGELACSPFRVAASDEPTPAGRPLTAFERKYRAEGRPLYYATFTKPVLS